MNSPNSVKCQIIRSLSNLLFINKLAFNLLGSQEPVRPMVYIIYNK